MKRFLLILPLILAPVVMRGQVAVLPQQNTAPGRITLDVKNAPLSAVLDDIARQGNVRISYQREQLGATKINANVKDATVRDALQVVLSKTSLQVTRLDGGQLAVIPARQSAKAQGVISGRITDIKTGRSVSGANVSIGNDIIGAISDENGSYRLTGVTVGTHTVIVRLVGYAKQTRSVTVGEGATVTTDFKLEPSASVLNEVVVTGTVVSTELKAVPNAITVVTAKQIEERGITRIDQLFRGDIPGIFALNSGSNSQLDEVFMFSRGATTFQNTSGNAGASLTSPATNPIKTYVDGVELVNPTYLSQIDPRSIERIEILTGPQASTIYGSNAINGVMQIFTKRGLSANVRVTIGLMEGVIQNNYTSAGTPMHTYDGQIAGTEGNIAYNVGGSWDYMGAWTPGKQTQRSSGYGGIRAQAAKFTVDGSIRRGLTANLQRGYVNQGDAALRESGVWIYSAVPFTQKPRRQVLDGQTMGLSFSYAQAQWLSHELALGSDASNSEAVDNERPQLNGVGDSLRFYNHSANYRTSQRYVTTARTSFSGNATLAFTLGVDHWINKSITISGSSIIPQGALNANTTTTRNKPDRNTGGFMQSQLGLWDALFLTYGLRAEWNPNYGKEAQPNLAPRYGIAYAHDGGGVTTKVRASYGRATRPPAGNQKVAVLNVDSDLANLYGRFNRVLANVDLEPEVQQGGEGGLEMYFGNRGSLIVSNYNQTVDKLIAGIVVDSVRALLPGTNLFCNLLRSDGYCYQNQTQNLNIGSIRNQGWELQGSVNFGPVTTRGTYSWTKSRIIGITSRYRSLLQDTQYQPGFTFNFLPEHTWSTSISYGNSVTNVVLNVNGIGFMYRADNEVSMITSNNVRLASNRPRATNPALPLIYRATSPGYATADLNASHRFSRNLETVVQIHNLANSYQNDRGLQYAAIGRQSKLGIRIKL